MPQEKLTTGQKPLSMYRLWPDASSLSCHKKSAVPTSCNYITLISTSTNRKYISQDYRKMPTPYVNHEFVIGSMQHFII